MLPSLSDAFVASSPDTNGQSIDANAVAPEGVTRTWRRPLMGRSSSD